MVLLDTEKVVFNVLVSFVRFGMISSCRLLVIITQFVLIMYLGMANGSKFADVPIVNSSKRVEVQM